MIDENPDGITVVSRTVWGQGELCSGTDQVVNECAVALVYNGISHVVMMATPAALEDFALGFSLSEGILKSPSELLDFEVLEAEQGLELSLSIPAERFASLKERRRNLVGRTGCGLCGAESLEQAITLPNKVTGGSPVSHRALQQAVQVLNNTQTLQKATGAVHAAAWFDVAGNLGLLREDVGRHNALDKLLGAHCKLGNSSEGFVLVTSRASYEMVVKAASANVGVLAALSGPTSMAIDLAEDCGLTLIGFTRPGRHVIYTHPQRLVES